MACVLLCCAAAMSDEPKPSGRAYASWGDARSVVRGRTTCRQRTNRGPYRSPTDEPENQPVAQPSPSALDAATRVALVLATMVAAALLACGPRDQTDVALATLTVIGAGSALFGELMARKVP